MEQLVKRIIFLIENLETSKSDFSAKSEISLPIISHISSGRNKPSIEIIQKIIKAYPNINTEWLLTGFGNWKIDAKKDNQLEEIKSKLELLNLRFSNTKMELEQSTQLLKGIIEKLNEK